jgi:hypothetical protein
MVVSRRAGTTSQTAGPGKPADGHASTGRQRTKTADRPNNGHGNAGKDDEGRQDKPGKDKHGKDKNK